MLPEPAPILEMPFLIDSLTRPGQPADAIGRDARPSVRGSAPPCRDLKGRFAQTRWDGPSLTHQGWLWPAVDAPGPTLRHHVNGARRQTVTSLPGTPPPCPGPGALDEVSK